MQDGNGDQDTHHLSVEDGLELEVAMKWVLISGEWLKDDVR